MGPGAGILIGEDENTGDVEGDGEGDGAGDIPGGVEEREGEGAGDEKIEPKRGETWG